MRPPAKCTTCEVLFKGPTETFKKRKEILPKPSSWALGWKGKSPRAVSPSF